MPNNSRLWTTKLAYTRLEPRRREHNALSNLRQDDRIQAALLNDVASPTALGNGVATGVFGGTTARF
jgi:hypothetical protein